jgi:hypothetical protein
VVATHGYADDHLALQEGLLPEAEWKRTSAKAKLKLSIGGRLAE